MSSKIINSIKHFQILQIIKDVFIPLTFTLFIIYSMMYFIPSVKSFNPDIAWPLSYFDWYLNFLTLQFLDPSNANLYIPEIGLYYLNTLRFVIGSLVLSTIIAVLLLIWRFTYPNRIFRFLINLLRISSGIHILALGLFVSRLGFYSPNPLDLRLLLILALGNGSLVELYNTLEAEVDKILHREYVLAGVAWGYPRFLFPLRELSITLVEYLNARLPILFSSTIVVEYIFSLDGISYLLVEFIEKRQFLSIITGSGLIGFTIIFSNVIVERIRYWLDPRVRHTHETP